MSFSATVVLLLSAFGLPAAERSRPVYRSPFDVVLVSDDTLAVVSDRSAGCLVIVNVKTGAVVREVPLRGEPTGLVGGPEGRSVFVSEYGAGSVARVDVSNGKVIGRWPVGRRPMGLALLEGRNKLLVANTTSHDMSLVDYELSTSTTGPGVPREAFFLASLPTGQGGLAGNLLPTGSPGTASLRTSVSWIEVPESGPARRVVDIALPRGSTSVRELAVSPDGRRAFVVHTIGRIHVPTTQLERGWVSTNALSLIDLGKRQLQATVLLDRVDEGASDPWGVCVAPSGKKLWVTLRGTHQLVQVDLEALDSLLEEWVAAGKDVADLSYDLTSLYQARVLRRGNLVGRGPRGMDVARDGSFLVVACYYSGTLEIVDARGASLRSISVGVQPPADLVRSGEQLFHDASVSFQNWLSCSTCHPDRGRNDGLHWDLPNDGLGTPQMTRSLLSSFRVAPTTARGVRPNFEASVTAGFRFLHTGPTPERVEMIIAYLASLEPESSPFLAVGGKLTAEQERGRVIFEGAGNCTKCHKGEIRTDLKSHKIGTAAPGEAGGQRFYTPKLLELYRTAPFLHDGRAASLGDIFRSWNLEERHGEAADLNDAELDDLIAYLMTL